MRSFIGHGHKGVLVLTPFTYRLQRLAPVVPVHGFAPCEVKPLTDVACLLLDGFQLLGIVSPPPVTDDKKVALLFVPAEPKKNPGVLPNPGCDGSMMMSTSLYVTQAGTRARSAALLVPMP
jgi:hypothetical protein